MKAFRVEIDGVTRDLFLVHAEPKAGSFEYQTEDRYQSHSFPWPLDFQAGRGHFRINGHRYRVLSRIHG